MDKKKSLARIPAVVLTVGSAVGLFYWFVMLFFAFSSGDSGPPDYERSVPLIYAFIITLGFVGAAAGFAAGILKSTRRAGKLVKWLPYAALALGAAGCSPLFILGLTAVGVVALLFGVVPPAAYIILTRVWR